MNEFEEAPRSYEEVLNRRGVLVFTPGGTSMLPLLAPYKNPVVIRRVEAGEGLHRGDVAFYRRPDGQYVLHRVIRVTKKGYICCGDHQTVPEKGVTSGMVLGVLQGFYRDEVYLDITDPALVAYGKKRMRSRHWRALKHCLRRLAGRA